MRSNICAARVGRGLAIGVGVVIGAAGMSAEARGQAAPLGTFVNWETPQVSPMAMTPDGSKLLVVNTSAARLEVFALGSIRPKHVGSVSVGLDPVSVRCVDNAKAWVVNHISDSISIVDLGTCRVERTLKTGDEPCDVVFAGNPARAFVTCSQVNTVQVFNMGNLDAAAINVAIDGEDPRGLAVSVDGSKVYAAVFESSNASTALGGGAIGGRLGFPPNVVSDATGPYGGQNPPPNAGAGFVPGIAGGNNPAIAVGLIVKKNGAGQWMDDNNGNWTSLVSGANASRSGRLPGWDMPDRDLAVIDAGSLNVSYATGLMNACMHLAVNPATGDVSVVGTDGTNEIRYEPNLKGKFTRVKLARVDDMNLGSKLIADINPHLTYGSSTIAQADRDRSIGDPRAIVFNAAGTKAYIAGMGSNNVIVTNTAGARAGLTPTIEVGEGPTGLVIDESRNLLYVLNRFEGSVSMVSLLTETEVARVRFFDPTPSAIKLGRKHLYDTHKNSGLGQISCASCHIDGRMDRLAWDLGDPAGAIAPLTDLNLGFGVPGLAPPFANPAFAPFHPMKGPMTTQTLQDIVGKEPHHWRGDRSGLEAFRGAFVGLNGDDAPPTDGEMQEFERFIETITFGPNPYRNFDNTLPTALVLDGHYKTGRFGSAGQALGTGNAQTGLTLYRSVLNPLDAGVISCVTCHTLPTGAGTDHRLTGGVYAPIAPGANGQHHLALVSIDGSTNISMKIPQLRNMQEKTGFNTTQLSNRAGFGYLHDGSVDSIERFVSEPVFTVANDQQVADLTAFMLAFSGSDLPMGSVSNIAEPPGVLSRDTHAAVGVQTTLRDFANPEMGQLALIGSMLAQADAGKVGVIAKGVRGGVVRGWTYLGGSVFQSDRALETITAAGLQAGAAVGSEITFTVVPIGTQTRLGIDADVDGCLDRDFLEGRCGNPACRADADQNGLVEVADIFAFLNEWFASFGTVCSPKQCTADHDADTNVAVMDIFEFLNDWFASFGTTCP